MTSHACSRTHSRHRYAAGGTRSAIALTAVALVMMIGAAGCADNEPQTAPPESGPSEPAPLVPKTEADRIMQAQIDAANALAKALETQAPDDEISALNLQFEQAGDAWNVTGLDEQEVNEATERYQALFDKAIRRLTKASMKGGTEAL